MSQNDRTFQVVKCVDFGKTNAVSKILAVESGDLLFWFSAKNGYFLIFGILNICWWVYYGRKLVIFDWKRHFWAIIWWNQNSQFSEFIKIQSFSCFLWNWCFLCLEYFAKINPCALKWPSRDILIYFLSLKWLKLTF